MAILDLDDDGKGPVKAAVRAPVAKQPEPGFLEPGSKSDAIVRGFSSGATFGLAPKISAGVNSLFGNGDYKSNLKAYLDANRTAQAAHPTASLVSNAVGALPSTIAAGVGSIPMQMAKSAGLGALDTYGSSEKTGVGAAKDIATGAAIGGIAPAILPSIGKAVGAARDVVRGTPNLAKIADATNKFRNALIPPTAGQLTPGSAKNAWAALQNPKDVSTEVTDQLIRSQVDKLPADQLKAVIASHNVGAPTTKSVMKDVATNALIGGGTTAVPTFFATEGDIGKTIAAGTTGAVGGAAYGAKQALTGSNARLRMPNQMQPASKYDVIGDTVQSAIDPLTKMGVQGAIKDVKEVTGTSTSPFGRLTDYMKQAQGSTNPAVQEVAEQAQVIADSNDPDAKRKAAMVLQDTPEGRAVGNSSSNVRDLD